MGLYIIQLKGAATPLRGKPTQFPWLSKFMAIFNNIFSAKKKTEEVKNTLTETTKLCEQQIDTAKNIQELCAIFIGKTEEKAD